MTEVLEDAKGLYPVFPEVACGMQFVQEGEEGGHLNITDNKEV